MDGIMESDQCVDGSFVSTNESLKNSIDKIGTGKIHLFMGPMGSGKTEMLLRSIRIHRVKGQKCVLLKHSNDDERGGVDQLKTKFGLTDSGFSIKDLKGCEEITDDCDVIGIDEGQFFPDLVEMCTQWAEEGKIVVVAALDGDYRKKPFDSIANLIPHCEKAKKLSAICSQCSEKAPFTRRNVDMGNVQNVAGGFELYSPLCRKCCSKP